MVQPIPEGYSSITPYLVVKGAQQAIDFYKQAFGATEGLRLDMPGGTIGHAELQIGNAKVMLADEFPDANAFAPSAPGRSGVGICLYVENCDDVVAQAVEAGAKIQRPLQDQFYGDRSATLEDPFGHVWTVATHIEDLPDEEVQERMNKMMGG